jgi:hypothetical protein
VQRHAELFEEPRRAVGGKRAQHARHQPRWTTPEVALGHHAVGDVAPRATAHQDLRAHAAGAVEHPNPQTWRGPGGKDGGAKPGGAPSNDDHVGVVHEQDKRTI